MNAGNAYAFAGNSPWNFEDPIGLTTLMDMLDTDSDIPSSYGGLATTEQGMQRLRERGLYNRADDIYRNPTHTTVQWTDGASVYIQRRNGRRRIYDYIVVGDDGIVSALDNIDSQELRELAEQFNWEDWLF